MRWQFVLSQVVSGLRRNASVAIAVVIVTFVSLTFVGAGAHLQMQVGKMREVWYDQVEIAVFMCPPASQEAQCAAGAVTDEQLQAAQDVLESEALAPYVQSVIMETPQEAYDNLQRITDAPWVDNVQPDMMQYSFRVKLVDPEQYQVVADELSGVAGVETVIDQREVLEPLFNILNRSTMLTVGLGLVLVVAAVLLITTTIRLSAMSRRRETEVLRLVGASNGFIQLPFMLEGALAALVGALLAVGALWAGVHYVVQGWFGDNNALVNMIDTTDVLLIAPFLVVAAIVLAGISSLVTLGRYTKV